MHQPLPTCRASCGHPQYTPIPRHSGTHTTHTHTQTPCIHTAHTHAQTPMHSHNRHIQPDMHTALTHAQTLMHIHSTRAHRWTQVHEYTHPHPDTHAHTQSIYAHTPTHACLHAHHIHMCTYMCAVTYTATHSTFFRPIWGCLLCLDHPDLPPDWPPTCLMGGYHSAFQSPVYCLCL